MSRMRCQFDISPLYWASTLVMRKRKTGGCVSLSAVPSVCVGVGGSSDRPLILKGSKPDVFIFRFMQPQNRQVVCFIRNSWYLKEIIIHFVPSGQYDSIPRDWYLQCERSSRRSRCQLNSCDLSSAYWTRMLPLLSSIPSYPEGFVHLWVV